jgi:hypothetical protein
MLALYPTVGAAALPDACTEPVDVPARVHTMFTLSCTPSPAALDQQINAEDLGDNSAYGRTWFLYSRPDPSVQWTKMAASDVLESGMEYTIQSMTAGQVSVVGDGGGVVVDPGTGTGTVAGQPRYVFTSDPLTAGEITAMLNYDDVDLCQTQAEAAARENPDLEGRRFVSLDLHSGARHTVHHATVGEYPLILTSQELRNVDGTSFIAGPSVPAWVLGWNSAYSESNYKEEGGFRFPSTLDGTAAPAYLSNGVAYTEYAAVMLGGTMLHYYRPLNEASTSPVDVPLTVGWLRVDRYTGETCVMRCSWSPEAMTFENCLATTDIIRGPAGVRTVRPRSPFANVLTDGAPSGALLTGGSLTVMSATGVITNEDGSAAVSIFDRIGFNALATESRRHTMCTTPLLRTVCIEVFPEEQQ